MTANDQYIDDSFQLVNIIYRLKEDMPITPEEQQLLNDWLNRDAANQALYTNLMDNRFQLTHLSALKAFDIPAFSAELVNKAQHLPPATPTPLIRMLLSRKAFKIAAAATVLMAFGLWSLWSKIPNRGKRAVANTATAAAIPAASDKATLTLSGGQVVELDAKQNTALTEEDGTGIGKAADQLIYSNKSNSIYTNTLTTPRGGKFRIELADGTKVWMNSASSLTYPTSFRGAAQRIVDLHGEAYFEVAKDAKAPFIVHVNDLEVKVTGTHFNIKGYADEPKITTTLAEGGVQVTRNNNTQQLAPGQQAIANKKANTLTKGEANVKQALAWKDGYFMFDELPEDEFLQEIARWYDIEIENNSQSEMKYSGVINRNISLNELLDIFRSIDTFNFKIVNRKLIILSK